VVVVVDVHIGLQQRPLVLLRLELDETVQNGERFINLPRLDLALHERAERVDVGGVGAEPLLQNSLGLLLGERRLGVGSGRGDGGGDGGRVVEAHEEEGGGGDDDAGGLGEGGEEGV